jgi:hypothetical protein
MSAHGQSCAMPGHGRSSHVLALSLAATFGLGARPCLAGAGSSPMPGRSWSPHTHVAAPSPGRQSSCAHATSPSRCSSRTSEPSSGRSSSRSGSRRRWPPRLAGAARCARGGSEAASLTTARGEQVAA